MRLVRPFSRSLSRSERDPLLAARASDRRRLVREVYEEVRNDLPSSARCTLKRSVLRALLTVPREAFVPAMESDYAYINHALPIGYGQTISQPLIVALMTELLGVGPEDTVLEVGTGCGYQAAVLAQVVKRVYTVEVVQALADEARARLAALGYENVTARTGDGSVGWPEHAPYDGVIVTAASPGVPDSLVEQLRPGRRLVIPLGQPSDVQWLSTAEKLADGTTRLERVLPVRFVPLTGGRVV